MTYTLWHLLNEPRIPPVLRWGFRVANMALNGEAGSQEPCSRHPSESNTDLIANNVS